jgi:hypothetical protein
MTYSRHLKEYDIDNGKSTTSSMDTQKDKAAIHYLSRYQQQPKITQL